MKKLSLSTTLAALLLAAVSCSNDEPEIPVEEPKIGAPAEVKVDSKAGTGKIAYTIANPVEGARIEAETTAAWIGTPDCTVDGEIRFTVEANDGDARRGEITLSYPKAATVTVAVQQTAAGEEITPSLSELSFATAGGEIDVEVASGRAWTLEGESEWLTPSAREGGNGDKVTFKAAENNGDDIRQAQFTFVCGTNRVAVTAVQSYAEHMIVDKTEYDIDRTAQTLEILFKANAEVRSSVAEGAAWIRPAATTSAMQSKTLCFEVEANDGDARTAVITLTCGDVSERITVRQQSADLLSKIVDEGLRAWIAASFDTDGDGVLLPAEAEAVTEIDYSEGAASAEGIEIFPNLEKLELRNATFAHIDLSKNTRLREIGFNNAREMESIDLKGCSAITAVNVGLCPKLTSIDLSNMPALTEFIGYSSGLTSLDTSHNPYLTFLSVYGSKVVELDLSANTELDYLSAGQNDMTSIDLSPCPLLTQISLNGTKNLTQLDLSHNPAIKQIRVDECDLRTVETDNLPDLEYMSIDRNNHLERLDISKNPKLKELHSMSYPGDGEGTYTLRLLRSQDTSVSLWLGYCCVKEYVD